MKMYSLSNGIAYCINCGKEILQNRSDLFCISCYSLKLKNGKFCYLCKSKTNSNIYNPCCKFSNGLDGNSEFLNEFYFELLNKYKVLFSSKTTNIIPYWAYGENSSQCIRTPNNTKIYLAETIKLIVEVGLNKFIDLDNIFDTSVKSNKRIINTLETWRKHLYVDPPYIKKQENEYYVVDGRHRIIAAYLLRESFIPIFI
jgi:hypothetical protein